MTFMMDKQEAYNCLLTTNDTTDRTKEIERALSETGVCRLGSGDFYVKNILMPENSMIIGNGAATRLILSEDVTEGYVVNLKTRCTVKDVYLLGSLSEITLTEESGARHGIIFEDPSEKPGSNAPSYGTIENCHFKGFSGGAITCHRTGYDYNDSMNVTDCWVTNCGVGINIPYWSEFHRFTNVSVMGCWYGCINNGGNNMFSNCNFSGNEMGLLMDNSEGQSRNETHGSMMGCVFNHSGHNQGTGIKILGTKNGFVFSGCQVFYSKIELDNVEGVIFNAFNFGRHEVINVNGGGTTMFTHCMFGSAPNVTITDNEHVKFINCYTRAGESI